VVVDSGELSGQPDAGPHPGRVADDVVSGDPDRPGVRAEQGGEDADQGGLAGAVGSEQPVDGAARDGEAQVVERADAAAERLGDTVGRDDQFHRPPRLCT
jgi:hypothetical protein